jgi:hypothetical protein
VNINLEISLHNAFKAATAAQGVDMTTVLQQFIENYVARYGASASQNRHRGESHLSTPATPPDKRVRIRRFEGLSYLPVYSLGIPRESK